MKKIILFVITLISLNSYAQNQYGSRLNNLEDLVVFYVNEYRASLGLNTLRKTKKYEDACDNQSQYLAAINYNRFHSDTSTYKAEKNKTVKVTTNWLIGTHNQEIDLPNWTEKTFNDRYKSLCGIGIEAGECISNSYFIGLNDSIKQTAIMIVDGWKKSPKHNEILKKKNVNEVSIAIRYFETSKKIKLDLPDIGVIQKNINHNRIISTIVVYTDIKNGAK